MKQIESLNQLEPIKQLLKNVLTTYILIENNNQLKNDNNLKYYHKLYNVVSRYDYTGYTNFELLCGTNRIFLETTINKKYIPSIMTIFQSIYDNNYSIFIDNDWIDSFCSDISLPDYNNTNEWLMIFDKFNEFSELNKIKTEKYIINNCVYDCIPDVTSEHYSDKQQEIYTIQDIINLLNNKIDIVIIKEKDSLLTIDTSFLNAEDIGCLIGYIFQYIYYLTDIMLIDYNGKYYFQTSNVTRRFLINNLTSEQIKKLAHDDIICESFFSDNCIYKFKNKIVVTDYNYIYKWRDEGYEFIESIIEDNIEFEVFDIVKTINKYKEIQDILKKIDNFIKSDYNNLINYVHFIFSDPVKIKNITGINPDHRGSDHLPINLEWKQTVKLTSVITFEELITSAYDIKSHKFDKHYEAFYCDVQCQKTDKDIIINVSYNHGS